MEWREICSVLGAWHQAYYKMLSGEWSGLDRSGGVIVCSVFGAWHQAYCKMLSGEWSGEKSAKC